VLALGSQSQVLGRSPHHAGILNTSLVHPPGGVPRRDRRGRRGLIVVHNHPSGRRDPSADDRAVTRQLVDAGRLLDLPVYDHVIVGAIGLRELR